MIKVGKGKMKVESSVIFFPCKDIGETKAYYTQVLQLPVYKDLGSTVWFDCGYGYLAFVQYGDGRPMASGASYRSIWNPLRRWMRCMKKCGPVR